MASETWSIDDLDQEDLRKFWREDNRESYSNVEPPSDVEHKKRAFRYKRIVIKERNAK